MRNLLMVLILSGVLAGCTLDTPPPTPFPTLTLIPATPSPTATQVPPTLTIPSRLSPSDLLPTITPTADQTAAPDDPIALELILLAKRRLVNEFGFRFDAIEVAEIDSYQWADTSLGCPLPDTDYPQVVTNGYRLLLTVAEQEFIFHTSFEQVVLCDPENEVLPD